MTLLLTIALLAGSLKGTQSMLMAQEPPLSASNHVVEDPDFLPLYTGGTAEMHRFISNTLSYPAEAAERDIQGLVVYTFVVEKDGTLSNFNIIHRADPLLDAEALRILQLMPPWRPARHNGEIVRAESYVPMYFKLNKQARRACQTSLLRCHRACICTRQARIMEQNEILTIVDQVHDTFMKKRFGWVYRRIRYPKESTPNRASRDISSVLSLCCKRWRQSPTVKWLRVISPQLDNEAIRVLGLIHAGFPVRTMERR